MPERSLLMSKTPRHMYSPRILTHEVLLGEVPCPAFDRLAFVQKNRAAGGNEHVEMMPQSGRSGSAAHLRQSFVQKVGVGIVRRIAVIGDRIARQVEELSLPPP